MAVFHQFLEISPITLSYCIGIIYVVALDLVGWPPFVHNVELSCILEFLFVEVSHLMLVVYISNHILSGNIKCLISNLCL